MLVILRRNGWLFRAVSSRLTYCLPKPYEKSCPGFISVLVISYIDRKAEATRWECTLPAEGKEAFEECHCPLQPQNGKTLTIPEKARHRTNIIIPNGGTHHAGWNENTLDSLSILRRKNRNQNISKFPFTSFSSLLSKLWQRILCRYHSEENLFFLCTHTPSRRGARCSQSAFVMLVQKKRLRQK